MDQVADLYFEDFEIGQRFRSRGVTFTESDIIDFALRYDPQPFHIDKVAAETGPYEGLIASGFQTLVMTFRMILQENLIFAASMGSPGIDELRWLRPVRPGDTVHMEMRIEDKRESRSKPDRGILTCAYTGYNQHGEPVISFSATQIFRRRPEMPD
jgi:acyl dehydratase